jgi:hypothetical protein
VPQTTVGRCELALRGAADAPAGDLDERTRACGEELAVDAHLAMLVHDDGELAARVLAEPAIHERRLPRPEESGDDRHGRGHAPTLSAPHITVLKREIARV